MKNLFISLIGIAGLLLGGGAQAQSDLTDIDAALKAAQPRQLPVFIDFSAVWCHSCHAMDAQVLNGADWDSRQTHFVLVRSDADSVNGSAWMHKLKINSLPTYVVLNPDGSERGRLVGEVKRAEFYPALDRLINGEGTLERLKAKARSGSVEAVGSVLRAYDERDQPGDGVTWFGGLPEAVRKAAQADAVTSQRLAMAGAHADMREALYKRKKLPRAQSARLLGDCRSDAQQALAGKPELDDQFDMARTLLACANNLPAAERQALAKAQLPVLKARYDKEVPTAGSGSLRDSTYTLVDYYEALGDKAAQQAAYERAITIGRKALDDGHGGLDVKRDRSMAQVLSEFLDQAGHDAEHTAALKTMVGAWPDDFFCQYAYGKDLLKHGKAAEALPHLERASDNASATWKLRTTYSRAKALVALNRRPEAQKLFAAALRTAEVQFPEETRMMKPMMKL